MPKEKVKYLPKLMESAWGGAVVGSFIMIWAKLPVAGSIAASSLLELFRKTAVEPEALIIIPVLLGLIATLALTGRRGIGLVSAGLLRPAMGFCEDFCVVAAGASLPFNLRAVPEHPKEALVGAALGFFAAALVGFLFHTSIDLSRELQEARLSPKRQRLIRWSAAIAFIAVALGCLFDPSFGVEKAAPASHAGVPSN